MSSVFVPYFLRDFMYVGILYNQLATIDVGSFLCRFLQTTKDAFNTQSTICLHCLLTAGRLLYLVPADAASLNQSALWACTTKD